MADAKFVKKDPPGLRFLKIAAEALVDDIVKKDVNHYTDEVRRS